MTTFSVNEAIEYVEGLAGKDISVRGFFRSLSRTSLCLSFRWIEGSEGGS